MEKTESEQQFRLGLLLNEESSKKLAFLAKSNSVDPHYLIRSAIETMWRAEIDDVK